jgi:2-hydroxy-3-keto-5-methylthiopentenyl-1-phosphate phosphatase
LPVASILTLSSDRVFAINFHHTDAGDFKSLDMSQDLMYHDGKKRTIDTLRKNYPHDPIIFIGDSVGDMEAGAYADLFI